MNAREMLFWRCPHLGLSLDPSSTALATTPDHRCFAQKARQVPLEKQNDVCLTSEFLHCASYRKLSHPETAGGTKKAGLTSLYVCLPALAFGLGAAIGALSFIA